MKKYLLLLLPFSLIFLSFNSEKIFHFSFTQHQLEEHFSHMEYIKRVVDNAHLDHQDAKLVIASLDSLENDLLLQVRSQLTVEGTQKTLPDTTKRH